MEALPAAATNERRMHIRYNISVSATVHTPLERMSARVNEISIMGARIRTHRQMSPGTPVRVYLDLDHTVVLAGEVLWVLTCFEPGGKCFHEAGIQIQEIVMPEVRATGLAARSEILPDILLSVKEAEGITSDRTA